MTTPDEEPVSRPEIETTATRVVYRNRWMTVREDAIVRADGAAGIYGVVEKPDFAVIVPFGEGQITLVEQFRYPVGARYWELPQGSWEGQDVDACALARAELREETGLLAASLEHVGRLFEGYGYCTQAYDVFLATGLARGETDLDAEELGLVASAFPLERVFAMIVDGTIRDATTVAALGLLRFRGLI